jgi:ArsR family transcriptional regulator
VNTEYQDQVAVFKAFCDENRLRILEMLRGGEKCACKLQEYLNIGQSSLSYHMKILVDSGIVESRQEGKWTHYRISGKGSEHAADLLKNITTANTEIQNDKCCEN